MLSAMSLSSRLVVCHSSKGNGYARRCLLENGRTNIRLFSKRVVSKEERAMLRADRRAKAADTLKQAQQQQQQAGGDGMRAASDAAAAAGPMTATPASSGMSAQSFRTMWSVGVAVPALLLGWALYDPDESPPGKLFAALGLRAYVGSVVDEFARPAHAKLLPDWSQMPNVPHDIPVPHTLVLDLENTLVSSTWDRKYGWRHAKRPGVDKFLHDMAQYYEIVLYSPSHEGVAGPVVDTLDKGGCIMHRLFRDATYYIDGTHVKDLSKLNRNLNRIVALDDDALALQLNPKNLIRVKTYDDPHDRTDRTLQRITPLLIEIAREGCQDVPTLLEQFRGMDADQMADEHERRVQQVRHDRRQHGMRGLGKLGNKRNPQLPQPELQPKDYDQAHGIASTPTAPGLTSKDLVGSAPPKEDGGGVMGWLNKRQKEQQEEQMRKMEKWNEIMMKKQMDKKKAEEEMQKRMAA